MVVLSAIEGLPLDLRGELAEEISMRLRVDLALEQFRRGLHRYLGHFAAQTLAGARGIELDLLLGRRDEALALRACSALRLFHEVVSPVLRVVDDLDRA